MNDNEAFTLREPVPADPYLPPPGPPWWVWAIAALLVALLATALVMAIRRRKKRRASGPDLEKLRRRALADLAEIDALLPPGKLASEVSLIVRRLLSDAFDDPVLFETHEEFISRRDALAHLPADQHDALARLFDTLVKFKYSPVDPDADTRPLLDEAAQLLARLDLHLPPKQPAPPEPPPLPHGLPDKGKNRLTSSVSSRD